jgi:chaperonin GroES
MKKSKKKVVKKAAKKSTPKKAVKKTVSVQPAASANKTGVTPLGDRILISPSVPESVTSFGLIIPETAEKEKSETGVVVAVGPGKIGDDNVLIPVNVSVGDKVMFNKYGYTEIKVNGKDYYIVSEADILAILS